jgi:hypothetical protein
MKHGPHCIPPDEVGAAGSCVCPERLSVRDMIEIARPCVRNELNRCEQQILMIKKSKPTPAHLDPALYLEALNMQATRLREALDSIDSYLGLT